jgi:hypothetical protein
MKRNSVLAVLAVLSMLACVIPGLSAQPVQVTDPNTLSTMVAGTAQALAQQTVNAYSGPTALPESTSSPMPTEAPTSTAAPQAPPEGTSLLKEADGTTKYIDYGGGYEAVFPVGWLAVRSNSEEFNAELANAKVDNPDLYEQMAIDQAGYDAQFDRLYSYPLRPDLVKNTVFGFSKVTFDSDDTTSLDNAAMGELVRSLESSGALPGFRVDVSQLYENVNGVPMLEIGGRFSRDDGNGGIVSFYSTIAFFKPSPTSLVRLTFTYLESFDVEISPDVRWVVESVKLLGQ